MSIKQILDEISNEPSTNQKMVILAKYKDNELLKRVIYLALSKRVKFYIKQIPEYISVDVPLMGLKSALEYLDNLSNRVYTGNEASSFLAGLLQDVHKDDAYVIERIISKDLKIGMGGNINKVFPKLIEETPYMGAKPFDVQLVKDLFDKGRSVFCDVKMDGRYNNAIIRNGDVELESRSGETVLLDSKFVKELALFPDCVLNGELTIDGIERYKANGMIRSMIDITTKQSQRTEEEHAKKINAFEEENRCTFQEALDRIKYTIWDTITVDEYFDQHSNIPYWERWSNVLKYINYTKPTLVAAVEKIKVSTYEEALKYFQNCLERGLEGIIVKSLDGKWKHGKFKSQIKMKVELNIDLQIIGFNKGAKGTKNQYVVSSILCQSSDGLLVTTPAGVKEIDMLYIHHHQEELLNTIVEVECSGITQDSNGNYSTLHPRLGNNKFRKDKTVADSLEQILENEKMCKGLK